MGWLVDPDDRSVFVYRPGQEVEVLDKPDDRLLMPAFMGEFTFQIADLFGVLKL